MMDQSAAPEAHPVRGLAGAYLHSSVLRRLAVFLVVSLTLVWAGVAAERSNLRRNAELESGRAVQNMALAFAEEVGSTISTVDVALLALRGRWIGERAGFARAVRELNQELNSKVIFHVLVTDAAGVVQFASSGPLGRRIDLSDRDYIAALLRDPTDRLAISRPIKGRVTGTLGVQFVRPVYAPGGELAGLIVASVAPEYLSRFYGRVDMGKDAAVALVRGGIVMARSSQGGSGQHIGASLKGAPFDGGNGQGTGVFRRASRLDGVERIYGWRRLPQYDLVVTVGQSVEEANSRYAIQQHYATAMGLAASAVLLALGWWAIAANHNRSNALRALAQAEARWKRALEATGAGVWDWDVGSGDVLLNATAQAVLGIDTPSASWRIGTFAGNVHPEDIAQLNAALRAILEGGGSDLRVEHRIVRDNGQPAWVLQRAQVVERGEDGFAQRVVGTVVNIDERRSKEESIRYQAGHDGLTGLANRILFGDRLKQALLLAQRAQAGLAVIYFDLDKFKPVNDTYGHAVGDQLLVEVAHRVEASLRQSDTLARLGGDEFAVLLPACQSAADAMTVAQGILALLNQPFAIDGHELHISGSLGVSLYPDAGPDPASVVHHADQAMYRSKQDGRNRVTLFSAIAECPAPAPSALTQAEMDAAGAQ